MSAKKSRANTLSGRGIFILIADVAESIGLSDCRQANQVFITHHNNIIFNIIFMASELTVSVAFDNYGGIYDGWLTSHAP